MAAAVAAAGRADLANSCLPQQGELSRVLAGGIGAGVIGEIGTGYGVSLAWLLTGAHPGARPVSVDQDRDRATVAAGLFADLLVLDGGGQGKGRNRRWIPMVGCGWVA